VEELGGVVGTVKAAASCRTPKLVDGDLELGSGLAELVGGV